MYSQCGGKTDTFPQMTIFDSLALNDVDFALYMNSSCGLDGQVCLLLVLLVLPVLLVLLLTRGRPAVSLRQPAYQRRGIAD